MLDKLALYIPFVPDLVVGGEVFLTASDGMQAGHAAPLWNLASLGLPLGSRSIHRGEGGKLLPEDLYHPYETLPSSFTGLAFKVWHEGNNGWPFIEVKASPAKLLQGHNVFGPTSIRQAGEELMGWLIGSYPQLATALEWQSSMVMELDCTYSARTPSEQIAKQVIEYIANVSNGHTKNRGSIYDTTSYFGAKNSRLKKLKIYLKWAEFQNQMDDLKAQAIKGDESAKRTFDVMSNTKLQDWCKCLVRFEATIKKRWLDRRNISARWVDLCKYQEELAAAGRCLLREMWTDATADIFKAFEGRQMRVTDDKSVLDALKAVHFRMTPKGNISYAKAEKLFLFYTSLREFGFAGLEQRIPQKTMWRHVQDLQAAGFTKAFLQNLHADTKANNIFPLLRFVEVDFSAQLPGWYVEPVSVFAERRAA